MTPGVTILTVDEQQAGQRIDNFLLARLKGVPKSRIYRIIRKGEVRVNKKRIKPDYKLSPCDAVRIPPVRTAARGVEVSPSPQLLALIRGAVLYEDMDVLIVNKPPGLPVHGGTGVKVGLIGVLRKLYAPDPFLELAHRLDKGTSGCIVAARNAPALKFLARQFKEHRVRKIYHATVTGTWPGRLTEVNAPLFKRPARGGERFVEVAAGGKAARTHFRVLSALKSHTLVEARPLSGRTHQIRVHAQSAGHPIAGDEKYNDAASNRALRQAGITRLCLHAATLELTLPSGKTLKVEAPYDEQFTRAICLLSL